jgi:flagellar assembly protein FliH
MDNLIRSLEISEQSIPLGLRRRPAAAQARTEGQGPAPVSQLRQAEGGAHGETRAPRDAGENKLDAARLDLEREKIRAELERELGARAESALQEARSRGLQEGLELGKAEALRDAERQQEAVAQTLATVAERAEQEIAGAEDAIVGIAFASVCKILGREVVDRRAVRAMVQQVLARAGRERSMAVRLHPQDCAALRGGSKALYTGKNGRVKVELVSDEEVSLGGCVVETSGGSLDARIETQLAQLRETLLKVRQGGAKKARTKP